MAQHRYRQHKVKREHTIIEGLLPLLQSIGELAGVQSVTPGRINQRSRTGEAGLFFQYKTETGLKLIGRSKTAVQEVFVVTDDPDGVIASLIDKGLIKRGKGKPGRAKAGDEKREDERATVDKPANANTGPDTPINTKRNSAPSTERGMGKRRKPRSHAGGDGDSDRSGSPAPRADRIEPAASVPQAGAPGESKAREGEAKVNVAQDVGEGVAQPDVANGVTIDGKPAQTIQKVEPKLWNEVLRLHQDLLNLEKRLSAEEASLLATHSPGSIDWGGTT